MVTMGRSRRDPSIDASLGVGTLPHRRRGNHLEEARYLSYYPVGDCYQAVNNHYHYQVVIQINSINVHL